MLVASRKPVRVTGGMREVRQMPKFVIERTVPGAGQMTPAQLGGISAQSNKVLGEIGSGIQWVQSYVTDDRLFCIYNARDEELIHEHARRGGFPCDAIRPVSAIIDPVTGEGAGDE